MADLHLHLDGPPADHPEWTSVDGEDDFDERALERALVQERAACYAALRDLDAA